MAEKEKARSLAMGRRKLLALSASAAMIAALAACGETAGVPTTTPAPASAPTVAPPGAMAPATTATAVPQSLGGTMAPAATPVAGAAMPPTTVSATAAPATAGAGNLADKQTFRFAGPEPVNFDPANCQDPANEPQVFEGLVTVSWKDGTLEPAMAQSYQANADATVWTFKMRPGMKWSDGTPITAKDFEYAWRRVVDPKTASIYTASLASVKNAPDIIKGALPTDQLGAKALDDATFEVTLTAPAPYFPLLAATWTCYPTPRHIIEKFGPKWLEAGNLVSNGPYLLTDLEARPGAGLRRQSRPIGGRSRRSPTPNSPFTMTHSPRVSPPTRIMSWTRAQVSPGEYDRVLRDAKLSKELKGYPLSQTNMLQCDATNKPTSDVRVRNALSLAFDRETLTNVVLKKYYLPAATILPPDIAGYNPAAALTGGVEKAKQLLADAGFPNGQGWPADFTLVYSNSSVTKTIVEYLQNEWLKNLGIGVKLQALEAKAYVAWRSDRKTMPFNLYYGGWGSDYGDPSNWHNFLFSADTDFYHTHWKNDQFEAMIAKAKGTTDQTARTKMYQDAEDDPRAAGGKHPDQLQSGLFRDQTECSGRLPPRSARHLPAPEVHFHHEVTAGRGGSWCVLKRPERLSCPVSIHWHWQAHLTQWKPRDTQPPGHDHRRP